MMMDDTEKVILDAAGGDQEAAYLLSMLIRVAHLWDDLVDQDSPWSANEADAVFHFLLCELPGNGFFQRHLHMLHPLIINGVTNWRVANAIERDGQPKELEAAYIMRSAFVDLIVMVAYLTQGQAAAEAIARRVRALTHHEGMDGYLKALGRE
jgi:hypothetical protein